MKRQLFIIGLLTVLLFIPLAAWAALVGKITNLEGRMDITPPGKVAVTAKIGDPVSVGDIIRTKSKSKCEITFSDGNVIRLAEETRLRISEYMLKDRQQYSTFNLFRGKVRSIVKKLEEQRDVNDFLKYEIFTTTFAVGVRGTDFIAFYQAGVSGATFAEGTGYGYSINRPQEIREITAGQTMIVTSPDIPPFVRPATTDEIGKHMKDTTPSEKPKGEGEKGKEDTKPKAAPATAEAKTDVGTTDPTLSQISPATPKAKTDVGTTDPTLSQTLSAATAISVISAPPPPTIALSDITYENIRNSDGSLKNPYPTNYESRQTFYQSVPGTSIYVGTDHQELYFTGSGSSWTSNLKVTFGGIIINLPANTFDNAVKIDYYVNGNLTRTHYVFSPFIVTNDGTMQATTAGASVNWVNATTGVFGLAWTGAFDPISKVWQMVGIGGGMDTGTFLNMAATTDGQTALSKLNIPSIQVGQADFTGSAGSAGNSISYNVTGMKFFSYSTGGAPRLWATGSITGSYDVSSSPSGLPLSVNLKGGNYINASGLSATATDQLWDTTNHKWGGAIIGTGTVNSNLINFRGGAAGTLSGGPTGKFSGTGSGIATP
ncbi:MAG: FecR family protein [Syntrophales bacterium]